MMMKVKTTMINRLLIWWAKRTVPNNNTLRKHYLIELLNRLGFDTFEHPYGDDMIGVKLWR